MIGPASRGATALACFAALVVGGFVSLFMAGPALFADGAFEQRMLALVISVVAFAVVGAVLGFSAPASWKPAAVCLALSAVPVVLFFGRDTFSQAPMALLSAGFALGDAASGMFGTWGGARVRFVREARRG